jgi:phage tail sheath protein FI
MSSYLYPGVYVEEMPSGAEPIEGVGTSVATFVGFAAKGPIGEPLLIFEWSEYQDQHGGTRNTNWAEGDPMGFLVLSFFQNGGTRAYIVRLAANR